MLGGELMQLRAEYRLQLARAQRNHACIPGQNVTCVWSADPTPAVTARKGGVRPNHASVILEGRDTVDHLIR